MKLLHPERLDALAREHALGTLHGAARRRFERLLAESPEARHALARWQEDFATLAAAVPPMAPREDVWQGLRRRLGFDAGAAPRGMRGWLGPRVLAGVLGGALAGVVASTALLLQYPAWLGMEEIRDKLPSSYVGVLSGADGKPVVLLSSRRYGKVLIARMLKPLPPPAGQVAHVWAYPEDGSKPFLVGQAPASGIGPLPLPDISERVFSKVERLGLSFEPIDSHPSAPGPLVVAGPCVKLW